MLHHFHPLNLAVNGSIHKWMWPWLLAMLHHTRSHFADRKFRTTDPVTNCLVASLTMLQAFWAWVWLAHSCGSTANCEKSCLSAVKAIEWAWMRHVILAHSLLDNDWILWISQQTWGLCAARLSLHACTSRPAGISLFSPKSRCPEPKMTVNFHGI